ncbi:SDR family NAD(P)-dependent oxidoreductase [Frateuria sp. GZRe12]|uniref:SDR family NAD(P)-dependent oxidoreductase n=1 Tax=Frateuria sp. GZRe12 TaxID=3351533 RepID=UPI003EDB710B
MYCWRLPAVVLTFEGLRVIVFGGSKGIGRRIASDFANSGANVSVCGRSVPQVEEPTKTPAGLTAFSHAGWCDVSDVESVKSYVAAAVHSLGGVDILVNCVSALTEGDDDESWQRSFSVDMLGIVRATNQCLPWLSKSVCGSIVNIASVSGLRPSYGAYGAIKAAVVHYTRSQARLLAGKNLRVNCIAPGPTDFPGSVWQKVRDRDPSAYDRANRGMPLGGFCAPEDVSAAVLFMASAFARKITGQVLVVDGGQMLSC